MHAETIVALIAAGLAALIAVIVPWMTFRLALRQDQNRWLREQRAQLYVDMLTEARAEEDYFHYAMADGESREQMRKDLADRRLIPLERARLGARATIFASGTVNRLFSQLEAQGRAIMFEPQLDEGRKVVVRVRITDAMVRLEDAIRRELGADRILLEPPPAKSRSQHPPMPPGGPSRPAAET
jgi:hypothetical protein